MKPIELQVTGPQGASDDWKLPYPRGELADPPITEDEAHAADTTICRRHRLIDDSSTLSEVEGRVYICGVGREYFRHSKRDEKMYAPLRYRG